MNSASCYEANQATKRGACWSAAKWKTREFAMPYVDQAAIIELKRKKTIRVGKLGEAVFPARTYVYTGSAMKGLEGRLRRQHCTRKKKIHWHIDYRSRCRRLGSDK